MIARLLSVLLSVLLLLGVALRADAWDDPASCDHALASPGIATVWVALPDTGRTSATTTELRQAPGRAPGFVRVHVDRGPDLRGGMGGIAGASAPRPPRFHPKRPAPRAPDPSPAD